MTCAETIATSGDGPDNAVRSIVEVLRAIEAIDFAIEELEHAELDEELDKADE